jgi:membrane protease YdiL (CAAX protease family)
MEATPVQTAAVALQLSLVIVGGWVLARNVATPAGRTNWFANNRLARWEVVSAEVVLLFVLVFFCGTVFQLAAAAIHGLLAGEPAAPAAAATGDEPAKALTGVQMLVYGFGFHAGGLMAWPLFASLRRRLFPESVPPTPRAAAPFRLPPTKVLVAAATTLAAAFPVIALASLGWNAALNAAGIPVELQPLIGAFRKTDSFLVFAGMILVACALAPVNEELLFRRALFHYLRQRFGRAPALLVSGLVFGAIHGHLAGFPALTLLGIALAVAYEKTGDIRVPIVAHGLFNLNTVIFVLAGPAP